MAALSTLLAAGLFCCSAARAQSPHARTADVEAAYLFNFTKFVEWPPDAFAEPYAPIVICVLGRDPFGSALDQDISGEHVDGRPLMVKRFARLEDLRPPCHLLFISSSEDRRLPEVLDKVGSYRTLTVADMDRFTQRGGAIRLRRTDGHIGFEINRDAADRAGVRISARLLRVALAVRER